MMTGGGATGFCLNLDGLAKLKLISLKPVVLICFMCSERVDSNSVIPHILNAQLERLHSSVQEEIEAKNCKHSSLLWFFWFFKASHDSAPYWWRAFHPGRLAPCVTEDLFVLFRPAVSQQYAPGSGNPSGPHPSYPQHYGPPGAMQQVTNQMSGMQINSGPPTPAGPGYGKSGQTPSYYLHARVLLFDLKLERSSFQSSLSTATEN